MMTGVVVVLSTNVVVAVADDDAEAMPVVHAVVVELAMSRGLQQQPPYSCSYLGSMDSPTPGHGRRRLLHRDDQPPNPVC